MEDDKFCFTPLPLPDDFGCKIPPTIDVGHMYASYRYRGLDVPNLHPAQERLMHYLKTNSLPPTFMTGLTNGRMSGAILVTNSSRLPELQ
jgi:hypothetical protein